VAMTGQRVEIAELPQGDVHHQRILSQRSLKSTLPDQIRGLDCARLQARNSRKKQSSGGNHG
jgi:hypothetical protein